MIEDWDKQGGSAEEVVEVQKALMSSCCGNGRAAISKQQEQICTVEACTSHTINHLISCHIKSSPSGTVVGFVFSSFFCLFYTLSHPQVMLGNYHA
jgi:hypothetical protein